MSSTKLKAEVREILGSKVKTLRSQGFIPANIFGKQLDSISIKVDESDFAKVYEQAGETGIVEIEVEGKTRPVLIDNVQLHPVTDSILHIDFKQVNLKEKVSANVPLEFVGDAPAEKQGLIVVQLLNEIEVEALPMELPESIEVDLSTLVDTDSTISISDLKVAQGVEILNDSEQLVANVNEPREEEPEEIVEEDEEAVEGQEAQQGESEQDDTKEEKPTSEEE